MLSRVRFLLHVSFWASVGAGERRQTLVVVYNVSQMVTTAVVGLADAHRVVREVDIAVVTCRRYV